MSEKLWSKRMRDKLWHCCSDCGYEIDPKIVPAFDLDVYGCPVCGSYDIDEEINNEGE